MAEDLPPSEMAPPWVVQPEGWTGIGWITSKNESVQSWRQWFLALSQEERDRYEAHHRPPPDAEAFYAIFGRPDWSPDLEADKWRDDEGYIKPPWIALPDIPNGSIGWRMGPGEDYYNVFYQWFSRLSGDEAADYAKKYPEPCSWHGKYAQIRAHPWK